MRDACALSSEGRLCCRLAAWVVTEAVTCGDGRNLPCLMIADVWGGRDDGNLAISCVQSRLLRHLAPATSYLDGIYTEACCKAEIGQLSVHLRWKGGCFFVLQHRLFVQRGQSPSRIWVSHVLSPLPYASTYDLFYEPGCTTPISTSSTSFVSKSSSTS